MNGNRRQKIKRMESFLQSTDYDPNWTRRSRENVPSETGFINPMTYWGDTLKSWKAQATSAIKTRQKLQSKRGAKYIKTMREFRGY